MLTIVDKNEGKRGPNEAPSGLDQVNETEGVHGNIPHKPFNILAETGWPLLLKRKCECHDVLS